MLTTRHVPFGDKFWKIPNFYFNKEAQGNQENNTARVTAKVFNHQCK